MGFANSIIGGAAALIRAAIKSPNYVPASAGWSINKDGSAEFSNITARGTISMTVSISGTTYQIAMQAVGSNPELTFTNVTNPASAAPFIAAIPNSPSGTELELSSGKATAGSGAATIALEDTTLSGRPAALISMAGDVLFGGGLSYSQAGNYLTADTWHDMRPLSGGFVGTITGEYPPQYQISPDGFVEIHGTIQLPPSGSYNSVTFFTLPAAYRPNHNVSWSVAQLGGAASTDANGFPRMFIDGTGACQVAGISSSINGTNIRITGRFPLDVTGVIQS